MSDQWATPGADGPDDGARDPGAPGAPPPPGSGTAAAPTAGSAPPPPPPTPRAAPPPPPPPTGPTGSGRRLLPLRPLRIGEVLDGAFQLVRANPLQLALLTLVTVGLLTLLQGVLLPTPVSPLDAGADPVPFDTFDGLLTAGAGLSVLVALVVTPAVNGALTWMGVQSDRGTDASWQAGLRYGVANFWRLLGTSLLAGLVAFLAAGVATVVAVLLIAGAAQVNGALAFVVGIPLVLGVLAILLALAALLYVAIPVAVVEATRPVASLRRSYRLLRPRLLRTVGIVVVTFLLLALVSVPLSLLATPFAVLGGPVGRIGFGTMSALNQVVTVPYSAFVALLVYTDARVRTEGLDVAVLAAELRSR